MTDLEKSFVDVRRAFRLLSEYQKRIVGIVGYIKEKSPFTMLVGRKLGSNVIQAGNWIYDYARLKVFPEMWGWDFLYGYLFEYYMGDFDFGYRRGIAEMSVFQVSDDGFAISDVPGKHLTDVDTFASPESSGTWLILYAHFRSKGSKKNVWLGNTAWDKHTEYLWQFLHSGCNEKIDKSLDGKAISVMKKYPVCRFATQESTDGVLEDFNSLLEREKCAVIFFR